MLEQSPYKEDANLKNYNNTFKVLSLDKLG